MLSPRGGEGVLLADGALAIADSTTDTLPLRFGLIAATRIAPLGSGLFARRIVSALGPIPIATPTTIAS